jgi:hypothetical protein
LLAQRQQRLKRLRTILGKSGELNHTHELASKQPAFDIECGIVRTRCFRGHDYEVHDFGTFFAGGFAKDSASSLYELTRVSGTGEQIRHAGVGNINALIETSH